MRFNDVTAAVELTMSRKAYGPSWGDYDGDGAPDLLAAFHGTPGLYHNAAGERFVDVTASLPKPSHGDGHGVAWGDYDGDGDADLYLTRGANRGLGTKSNELLRNDGDGRFTPQATAVGLEDPTGRGRQPCWLDYDSDGALDLYIANFGRDEKPNPLFRQSEGRFHEVTGPAGLNDAGDTQSCAVADYDNDGDPDLLLLEHKGVTLYENRGDGTFANVTQAAGLPTRGVHFAGAWADHDNDGDLDLYLSTGYFGSPKDLFVVKGEELCFAAGAQKAIKGLTFTTADAQVQFDIRQSASKIRHQVWLGPQRSNPPRIPFVPGDEVSGRAPALDPANDRGYSLWRDGDSNRWHLQWVNGGFMGRIRSTAGFSDVESKGFRDNSVDRPNRLYENRGDGTFRDVTERAGVAGGQDSRGAVWGDFDNDGWVDLFVVERGGACLDDAPDRLYWNQGDGTFLDVAATAGVSGPKAGLGGAGAAADYNVDGRLDLIVMNGETTMEGGPTVLLQNDTPQGNWLQLRLVGTESNRDGTGSWVTVEAGPLRLTRYADGGAVYHSQNGPWLHFGLGGQELIDRLEIRWPSGRRQVVESIQINRRLTLVEGQAEDGPAFGSR